tara:strand:- start:2586 stop:2873 length:288 start_codon:yes stop_codon:yes gene_type:complete
MATLTAASTMTDIIAEFKTCASYSETADLALAKRFITACRMILALRGSRMRNAQQTLEFDVAAIDRQLVEAQEFVRTTASGNRTARFASFGKFRT